MAEGKKLDLEELRKSFPSLDGLSARTLLGGGVEIPGPFIGWNEDGSPVFGDPFPPPPPPPGGNSESGGPLTVSTGFTGGGSGSDYFGDWDSGDDYGDFGWGEGWGDYDGGTDSNPGGSEVGNGQDSSGNSQSHNPELPRYNNGSYEPRSYDIKNYSSNSIWIKYGPFNTPILEIPPGGTFSVSWWQFGWEIDGININGNTYKITDGYNFIEVFDYGWITNYWTLPTELWYQENGGYQSVPPNNDWNELFYVQ